jgi:signal transduction histidine kinase
LSEHGDFSAKLPTITTYFDDNFPPWRVEFFSNGTESLGFMNVRKSYYFWTILTVLVLLTFGTVLVVRTITHEMEVLRIKSDFVSSVSHEFKTPITSIKALVERLQQEKVKSSHKKKNYYAIISKDADKLNSLVRNILDFSKVEEGRKEFVFQETDVAQLVKDEIENFKKEKIYAGIRIDLQISPDIPNLYVDRESFSLALDNLLENSFKFSPERKGILVEVKKDAENVRVDVKDKGMGIPSEEMDKIFDKFYQGKNAAQQSIKGTGLGLALVKHTVEAHGGKVLVESNVGQGSTFSLIFPVRNKGSKL